jgi:hypothetical protein
VAGAAGRADLRDAGPDGPPPGSCRFAGDLLVAGAYGAYRLAARAAFGLRGTRANGGSRPSAPPASGIAGQEAVVLAAGAAADVVPPAASVAVGGRSVPLRACTAAGDSLSSRCLASRVPPSGSSDQCYPRYSGPVDAHETCPSLRQWWAVGERLPATARRVIVARQSPFSARQITRCRRIARNSALDTEDELK